MGSAIERATTVPAWIKDMGKSTLGLGTPPSMADARIAGMGAAARARLASVGGMGFGSTLKTGAGGAPAAPTTKATLTGGNA
jgi:hypothetical protein